MTKFRVIPSLSSVLERIRAEGAWGRINFLKLAGRENKQGGGKVKPGPKMTNEYYQNKDTLLEKKTFQEMIVFTQSELLI